MNKLINYLEAIAASKGNELSDTYHFRKFESVNRKEYQHFVPILCEYITYERNCVARFTAYDALAMILLPDPGNAVIDFLIDRLASGLDYEMDILRIISELKIPQDTNLEPLEEILLGNNERSKKLVRMVLSRVEQGELLGYCIS